MAAKILMGAYEVPGYGGASTMAYRMFEDLQQQGLDVSYVNIIGRDDEPYLRVVYGVTLGNPRGLPNVYNVVLERAPFYPTAAHAGLARLIEALAPDVLVAKDFIATLLMKSAAPARRLIFLTAGCKQAGMELERRRARSVSEILTDVDRRKDATCFQLPPRISAVHEAAAVACADLIVVHSEMIRELYRYYYPGYADRLFPETVWQAEWSARGCEPFLALRKPFAARAVDVLFIASQWGRSEKNWALARELIVRHPELNVHVVGETELRTGSATFHGLIADRSELFALMGDARVVVSPSRLDAAPGILFEAAHMGCNIVASKNCGNWELCHPALLADSLEAGEFSRRICAGRARAYAPNLARFLEPSGRQTLREILEVF